MSKRLSFAKLSVNLKVNTVT